MIQTYIQKGEVVLVYSNTSFTERVSMVHKSFHSHPDIVIFEEEKMKIDTVRDFVYEMQKGSTGGVGGVSKIGVLICDDIALPAQHALLKVLEDLDSSVCIIIYAHVQSVFMSTVLSRVIEIHENNETAIRTKPIIQLTGNTVAERLESVKKIMKAYDDEKITKQDIIEILEDYEGNREVYLRALSMLKQPSVSVKYVLEYIAVQI